MLSKAQNVLSLKGTRWQGVISALWIRDNLPPESWLSNTDHRHFICIIHHPEEQQRRVLPAPWLWHGARFKRKKKHFGLKNRMTSGLKNLFLKPMFQQMIFFYRIVPLQFSILGTRLDSESDGGVCRDMMQVTVSFLATHWQFLVLYLLTIDRAQTQGSRSLSYVGITKDSIVSLPIDRCFLSQMSPNHFSNNIANHM